MFAVNQYREAADAVNTVALWWSLWWSLTGALLRPDTCLFTLLTSHWWCLTGKGTLLLSDGDDAFCSSSSRLEAARFIFMFACPTACFPSCFVAWFKWMGPCSQQLQCIASASFANVMCLRFYLFIFDLLSWTALACLKVVLLFL